MSDPHIIGPVSEERLDELLHIGSVAFGPAPSGSEEALRDQLRRQLPFTLGSYHHDRLASVAVMLPFEAWVGGVIQRVAGLANVATAPWARRRGHVAGLLRHWLEHLHDEGVGWSAEHPFDPRFYARYGFQSLPNGQVVDVAPDLFGSGRPSDARYLEGSDLTALKPIHTAFAQRYSFSLTREGGTRDAWRELVRPWSGPPRHAYLLEDAYVLFRLSDDGATQLHVTDFAYATPQGRERLWRFLASFRGQARRVRIHLPPGEPLLADTQARHGVRTPLFQVRVVDLRAALAPLRAPHESRWRLAVHDALCPWNDGTFALALTPEGCTVESGGGEAEVALDVAALVALLGHAATPELLLATGRATGVAEPLRALAELTRGQPPFLALADGF